MTRPAPIGDGFYRPAEVARKLRCSEWWVKEQARQRRIPYAWIGGSYLFTDEHIAEIIRIFEVRPVEAGESVPVTTRPLPRPSKTEQPPTGTGRLVSRPPRRARLAMPEHPAA